MSQDVAFGLFIVVVLSLYFYEWDRIYGKPTNIPSPLAYLFIRRRLKKRR